MFQFIKRIAKTCMLKYMHIDEATFQVLRTQVMHAPEVERDTKFKELLIEPGHYYSPIPNLDEIRASEDRIFVDDITGVSGIDLNLDEQLALLPVLSQYVTEADFPMERTEGFRFYHRNLSINKPDSLTLHAMLRYLKPKHVIEVGSGFSSAMMLDTNERYLNGKTEFTFIEPYPADILKPVVDDVDSLRLIPKKLQQVPLSEFELLESGDILYIDSTHVSKIGSDVNYNIFQILPSLKKGVFIHFHDILWPFEYPRVWIYENGYHWSEAYLLRAFLQYNTAFKIRFWAPCLNKRYPDLMKKYYPIPAETMEGECPVALAGSIWLEKVE